MAFFTINLTETTLLNYTYNLPWQIVTKSHRQLSNKLPTRSSFLQYAWHPPTRGNFLSNYEVGAFHFVPLDTQTELLTNSIMYILSGSHLSKQINIKHNVFVLINLKYSFGNLNLLMWMCSFKTLFCKDIWSLQMKLFLYLLVCLSWILKKSIHFCVQDDTIINIRLMRPSMVQENKTFNVHLIFIHYIYQNIFRMLLNLGCSGE